jgi:transposase
VPALPSSVLEPLWVQVAALLPTRHVHHPLGCHRRRIPDRVVFDKLVQVLCPAVAPQDRRSDLLGDHPAAPPR